MKPLHLAIPLLWISHFALAQDVKFNQQYQDYINQYKEIAIQQQQKYNIPASITLAQALLESGAGRSELTRKGNNHFGIKCHGWTGKTVYHDDDATQECFRAYPDALQSFEDHSQFLATQKRYAKLFELKITDYKGWANGLKSCGYATSPTYAQKLISIIEVYHLQEYDQSLPSPVTSHPSGSRPGSGNRGLSHTLYSYNHNYYLKTSEGDTFETLAKEVGISAKKLAKYNEYPSARETSEGYLTPLPTGTIVYLKKKQKHADPSFKNKPHTVKSGESLHLISQYYGIRLKSLYKLNRLSPNYQPRVGDRLRVY